MIVANNNWQSWPEKIEAIKEAFLSHVDLEIDLIKTQMTVIPFTDYGEGRLGVEHDFYNKNVTVKANGYDIVEFVVPLSQWQMPQRIEDTGRTGTQDRLSLRSEPIKTR